MIALFFDTETTGFSKPGNPAHIVQIAAILQNITTGRVLHEMNFIVRADKDSDKDALAVHNIGRKMTDVYGIENAIADNMLALLAAKADVIVAHNIDFDEKIIKNIWPISSAIIADKDKFCTMRECRRFDDMPRRHANRREYTKLIDAYYYFYSEHYPNAHDAMADVRACRDVYFKLNQIEYLGTKVT